MHLSPLQHTVDTPYPVGPVHFYSVEIGDELILFDTGPPTQEAQQYLRDNIDLSCLKHVFITHGHIDHYGLSRWLEQESDAVVYLPERDVLKMVRHDTRVSKMKEFLKHGGFSDNYLDELGMVFSKGNIFPDFPTRYQVAETDIPDHLKVEIVACPGHSQSDLVYLFDNYAVTGDTLLKGIFQSPLLDVDLLTNERFNNYESYCDTIVKLARFNNRTILPGHRHQIQSVMDSIHFYVSKLLLRAMQIRNYTNERDISGIIKSVFSNSMTNVFHIYLKASEILFMQDFLKNPQKLHNSLQAIGMYETVKEQFEQVTTI